jgi:DNA-binding transcriptional LysR family regulator
MLHNVSNPDIHLLRVFAAVVEAGGFSAAQISLNVAQSTISTQMTDLESRLGMRLCNRGRTGFSLTDDGRVVYEAAQELFRSLGNFTNKVNDRRVGLAGTLRIGYADALIGNSDFKLVEAISLFISDAPDVELEVNTANPLVIEHGVLDGRYHIGIHTFPNHAPGLTYATIFSERQTLYCGEAHPLFEVAETEMKSKDVEQLPYARRTYYGGTLQTGAFRPKNVVANSDTMEALGLLILSGKVIGHLPTKWAEGGRIHGRLRAILENKFSYESNFEVVVKTGAQHTKLVRTFLQELFSLYGGSNMGIKPKRS